MFIIIVLRFTRIFSEKDVKNMKIEIAPDIHKVLAAPLGAAIDVSAPLMCERGE